MSVYSRIGQNIIAGYALGKDIHDTRVARRKATEKEAHEEKIIADYEQYWPRDEADDDYEPPAAKQTTALPVPGGAPTAAAPPAPATPATPAEPQATALPPPGSAPSAPVAPEAAAAPGAAPGGAPAPAAAPEKKWTTQKTRDNYEQDLFAYNLRYHDLETAIKGVTDFRDANDRRASRAMKNAQAALTVGDNRAAARYLMHAAQLAPGGYVPQIRMANDGTLLMQIHDETTGDSDGTIIPVTVDTLKNIEAAMLDVQTQQEMTLAGKKDSREERAQTEAEAAGKAKREDDTARTGIAQQTADVYRDTSAVTGAAALAQAGAAKATAEARLRGATQRGAPKYGDITTARAGITKTLKDLNDSLTGGQAEATLSPFGVEVVRPLVEGLSGLALMGPIEPQAVLMAYATETGPLFEELRQAIKDKDESAVAEIKTDIKATRDRVLMKMMNDARAQQAAGDESADTALPEQALPIQMPAAPPPV